MKERPSFTETIGQLPYFIPKEASKHWYDAKGYSNVK